MHEANQMQDQVDIAVKKALNPMTYIGYVQNIYYIMQTIQAIKEYLNKKSIPTIELPQGLQITFTGNDTDIANIEKYHSGLMPKADVELLQPSLREQVEKEFSLAMEKGFVKLVNVEGVDYYQLTPLGKEHILSEDFIKRYEENTSEHIANSDIVIGKPISFNEMVDMTAGKIIDKPIYICERSKPDTYIEISSFKDIDQRSGNPFVNTEYKVFKEGEQQHCSEFKHGKFTRYTDFQGNNTSKYGEEHWQNMQNEILNKCGFTDDLILFDNRDVYLAYIKRLENESSVCNTVDKNNYKFTGQHTDIANIVCYNDELMPITELDNITDKAIKENVTEEYNIAIKNGYIEIVEHDTHKFFGLTDKGREHINSEAFLRQYKQHQLGNFLRSEPKMVVNFQGNEDDLNVFRYVDKVDISKESDKVKNYFTLCEKSGFVNINNGISKPTELTYQWLERTGNNALKNGNIKLITTDNIKEFTKDIAKTSAKESVATSVGASSGAVTAGVGTIITISVESAKLIAKGISQQKQNINNLQARAMQ